MKTGSYKSIDLGQNQRDTLKRKVNLFKNEFVNDICLFPSSAEYFNLMVQ
jgi:hypothetical protein